MRAMIGGFAVLVIVALGWVTERPATTHDLFNALGVALLLAGISDHEHNKAPEVER